MYEQCRELGNMIAFVGASTRNGTILQSFVREIGHSFKRLDDAELCIKARLVESIVPTTRWNVYKTIVTRSILLSLYRKVTTLEVRAHSFIPHQSKLLCEKRELSILMTKGIYANST